MLSSDNKRIAQNAGMLYVRMLFLLFTTLYTSRVILNSLGVVDYGIQNVVAGIITLFSFLNTSMSTATQRYLTFTLGTGNQEELKRIFSTSFIIHIGIALFLWAIAESIGVWFVNHQLNVPPSRLEAANWIFQFSMLSMALTIVQVPFNALLIAHERMNIYAYMSIFEVLTKLFIAYAISWFHGDRLILYGFLLFIQTGISISIYVIYCSSNFEECRIRLHYCQRNLFKQITSFAGWNLFGSIAWIFKNQGGNIVLNLFFGPTVNAAYGIAFQVTNAIKNFVGNVQMAFNPQITKKYAENKQGPNDRIDFPKFQIFISVITFLIAPRIHANRLHFTFMAQTSARLCYRIYPTGHFRGIGRHFIRPHDHRTDGYWKNQDVSNYCGFIINHPLGDIHRLVETGIWSNYPVLGVYPVYLYIHRCPLPIQENCNSHYPSNAICNWSFSVVPMLLFPLVC